MQGLLRSRLHNQRLTSPAFRTPAQVVSWFGAMQAQDYPGARWAIGLRAPKLSSADVDDAFHRGEMLRTHILRPTWHFVTPADIRWMQSLTGPRVRQAMSSYWRKLGLDARTQSGAIDVIVRALDGRQLTRDEIAIELKARRIDAAGPRLGNLLMAAELAQAITSGGIRHRKLTYARLDDRAPMTPAIDRDDAIARLTRRFFTSHGPATKRDMAWWSGLPQRDVTRGLEMLGEDVESREHDGCVYWSLSDRARSKPATGVWLLPNYDEFLIAYKDRRLSATALTLKPRDIFAHFLVIDGVLAGVWRRSATGAGATATEKPYRKLSRAERAGLRRAADQFARFHESTHEGA